MTVSTNPGPIVGTVVSGESADPATGDVTWLVGEVAAMQPDATTDVAPVSEADDPYLVYLGSLSSSTSQTVMKSALDRIARICLGCDPAQVSEPGWKTMTGAGFPWHLLRYRHTARLRSILRARTYTDRTGRVRQVKEATVNQELAALKGVLKAAWTLELMTTDDYHRAVNIKGFKASRLLTGRMIGDRQISDMLNHALTQEGPVGVRDAAMLATALATGLRRTELVTVRLEDWDDHDGLRVIGKGNKERQVPLAPWVVPYLNAWLAIRGHDHGPLFNPCDRWGNIRRGQALTSQTVWDAINRHTTLAGGRKASPHDLRRTMISHALTVTDIATVQALAGHANPATTTRYNRRGIEAAIEAVKALPAPKNVHLAAIDPDEQPDQT